MSACKLLTSTHCTVRLRVFGSWPDAFQVQSLQTSVRRSAVACQSLWLPAACPVTGRSQWLYSCSAWVCSCVHRHESLHPPCPWSARQFYPLQYPHQFLRLGTLEWLAVNLARCWVSPFPTSWPVCDLHWGAENTPTFYEWWLLTGHRHTANTGKMAGWR